MENLPRSEQSVVECPEFYVAPSDEQQKSDYGVYGSFEGLCAAMAALFEKLTPRERLFFIFALECCLNGPTH